MSSAARAEGRWDFFVAHAGADAPIAARITTLLEAGGASVFLDDNELLPGDVWPRVLAQAQASSAVTVILVSKHTAAAYYHLEELAEAIEMSRDADSGHRVAPVYLEPVEQVPYGLRVVHGLWALDAAGVAVAARQLLRLLPRPGDQPPAKLWGPQIPAVTEFFAGRDELLGRLAGHGSRRTSVLTQSMSGLGGVGKTTLAAALCREQAQVVDIVWWLRSESETTLIADLAELAGELGLTGAGGENLALAAERASRALEREPRSWLLVFDNAESDDLVHRFTPRRGEGRVLLTTRRRSFRRLGPVVDVDVFDPATAEGFLRARVADTNPVAAQEPQAALVARRLGGLPLALEQAGAYVAYSPLRSFAAYLDLLDEVDGDPFVDGRPLDYQATATTTWRVSIDATARRAPVAPKIMAAFAYLAPAPIPIACFVDLADHPYLAATVAAVTAAIDELYAYSLITIEHQAISVHRVVRDAARRPGDPAAARFVVDALRRVHPEDVARPGTWPACAELLAHVQHVAGNATDDDPAASAEIGWLLDRAGQALDYAGAAVQAIPLLEQAAHLDIKILGGDHPDTLQSRNNLAAAYWAAGRNSEAITVLEANLTDRERLLGGDHRDTLNSRNNLAAVYRAAGRTDEAITLLEANLADRERLLGPDHPDTQTSRNNLAAAYRAVGRTDEALTLHQTNLADLQRLLGPDHPNTLQSRNNLAETYQAAGRTDEAITLLEANLADRERLLGPDHPDTLTSRNNLAAAYRAAGHTDESALDAGSKMTDR